MRMTDGVSSFSQNLLRLPLTFTALPRLSLASTHLAATPSPLPCLPSAKHFLPSPSLAIRFCRKRDRGEHRGEKAANKESPWSSCNKNVVGRCKLWMIITSVFLGLIVVIIIGVCLSGVTYVDEDENEILELSSNKTFLVMLKIPEECVAEEELPHLLTGKLTDVYSTSPSLSRYFTSVEIVDFSGENATVTYHLQFGVPSDDENVMKYMMSEELVLGILLQDFHDENIPGCESLGLDPASLLLYE
ncbi:TPA-induced transmembrane protein isoform X2 [Trachypithecus francoisi]|uniref:TPA-induced transmembrane protein isoform X2 n=1 Tax=Trachypithecus francoisi TaxID=54180 RepID=UPI00141B948A|nr:TPA-induced transmembrane protein isoform X2 [Trachypithecus francoisi]XP_033067212.1 TPA-induced transmembrane protein isoform X2 [Trachypithecus francoisi]